MSASSTAMRQMTYEEQVRLMRAEAVVSMLSAAVASFAALFATPLAAAKKNQVAEPAYRSRATLDKCPCYGAFY